jgi:type IV pilus assembly protein PilV
MALRVLPTPSRSYPATHGKSGATGFSMLEVMVSVFIILLGLLGLAGLIVRSNQAEMESYQRVQALMLVQDMVDRINANRKVVTCYSNGATGITLGTGASAPATCTAGDTQQNARANADLAAWNNLLLGSAEVSGASNVGAMIGARGCISEIDAANRVYIVSVAWQGLAVTAAPGNTCGLNQYGDDKQRRVVTAPVRIGALL